jgi:uncharacterized protein
MGRYWRTDEAGYLLNDADRSLIAAAFWPLVDAVVAAYVRHVGDALHSIYITGSVARGTAIAGQSDLDTFAVLGDEVDPLLILQGWMDDAEQAIGAQFAGVISHVQLDLMPPDAVADQPEDFAIGAFIIRTHSACVWGPDLAPELPDYNLNDPLVRLAIANDDLVQIGPDIAEAIAELAADGSAGNVAYWGRRIGKNMLRTGFGLTTLATPRHTRDADLCCAAFAEAYPAQAGAMRTVLAMVDAPPTDADAPLALLRGFGAWLADEADRWLDAYNPERRLAFRLYEA